MSLNPGGTNYNWNYSNPNKPDYSTQLVGTVVSIQEVQKRNFSPNGQPGSPAFWPDGNPVWNIRIALATEDGGIRTFTFQPAGKEARAGLKRSVHMDLFRLAGGRNMTDLIGKTICIQTQEGTYGRGNPRPWEVFEVEAGPFLPNGDVPEELKVPQVLANTAAAGGQVTPPQVVQPPQQQYQPVAQQYQQPAYVQPAQPAPQVQPQQQYQPMQQPTYQPVPQPVQQAPQGMDPAIMQAMQAAASIGAKVTEVIPPQQADPVGAGQAYEEYEEGMPF